MKESSQGAIPPVNFELLRKKLGNNNEIFVGILDLFLQQGPLWIQEINDAFASGDCERIRLVCHKIKGGASTAYANSVADAAAALGNYAKTAQLDSAQMALSSLVDSIDQALTYVRSSSQANTYSH